MFRWIESRAAAVRKNSSKGYRTFQNVPVTRGHLLSFLNSVPHSPPLSFFILTNEKNSFSFNKGSKVVAQDCNSNFISMYVSKPGESAHQHKIQTKATKTIHTAQHGTVKSVLVSSDAHSLTTIWCLGSSILEVEKLRLHKAYWPHLPWDGQWTSPRFLQGNNKQLEVSSQPGQMLASSLGMLGAGWEDMGPEMWPVPHGQEASHALGI